MWAGIPKKEWSSPQSQQRVQNVVLRCNFENNRMISVCFEGKAFNITVIQVYAPTTNAEDHEFE